MLGAVFQQYRRILLCAVLGFLSLLAFLVLRPEVDVHGRLWSFTGLSVTAAFALTASVALVFLSTLVSPKIVHLCELLMAGCLVIAVVAGLWPQTPTVPCLIAVVVMMGVFEYLLYGPHLITSRRDYGPVRLQIFTALKSDAVWRRLFPDPTHIGEYIMGGATAEPVPPGVAGDLVISYPCRVVPGGQEQFVVKLDEVIRNRQFRVKHFAWNGPPGPWNANVEQRAQGIEVYTMSPCHDGTKITIDVTFQGVTLPEVVRTWLNGWDYGTEASFAARLAGRRDTSLMGRATLPPAPQTMDRAWG